MLKKCKNCGSKLSDSRSIQCRSCSKKGKQNPMFGKKSSRNIGGSIGKLGYRFIWVNCKKKYEHRHIMELYLGRKLLRKEIVHHKDGNKLNNIISNLELTSQKNHLGIHKPRLGTGKKRYENKSWSR